MYLSAPDIYNVDKYSRCPYYIMVFTFLQSMKVAAFDFKCIKNKSGFTDYTCVSILIDIFKY